MAAAEATNVSDVSEAPLIDMKYKTDDQQQSLIKCWEIIVRGFEKKKIVKESAWRQSFVPLVARSINRKRFVIVAKRRQ